MKADQRKNDFWIRAGFIYAITNLAISQVTFNCVLSNLREFPRDIRFYLWDLLWFQVLPFIALFSLDVLVDRISRGGRLLAIWRALLGSFLALSLERQFEVQHPDRFHALAASIPIFVVYAAPAVLLFFVLYRWKDVTLTYLAYLGGFSIVLMLGFVRNGGWVHYTSEQTKSGAAGPPVFMIVFDEMSYDYILKDGSINREAFPRFAELASTGLWFTNVTTNFIATQEALPTLLTGRRSPDLTSSPTLFDSLPSGYHAKTVETEIMVENWLRDRSDRKIEAYMGKSYALSHRPLATGSFMAELAFRPMVQKMQFVNVGTFTYTFQSMNTRSFHITVPDELSSFLNTIDAKKAEGQFSFWHASIPHAPFIFSHDGSRPPYPERATFFPSDRQLTSAEYRAVMGNYVEQTKFVDLVLGKVIDRLKQQNLYDKAIVVVLADHGLRVWSDFQRHTDLTARIPLVLHGPGIAPGVNDTDVQLIDVLPTVLDVLKAPEPSGIDGVSAFAAVRPQRQKVLHSFPMDVFFNNDTHSWQYVGTTQQQPMASSLDINIEFSAIEVQDDMTAAHQQHADFLEVYLSRHFPESVSDEKMEWLRMQSKNAEPLPDTPSNHFKKGVYAFFVALAETQRISQGRSEDPAATEADWNKSLSEFRKVGDLQSWLADYIENLMRDADTDGDHKLSAQELSAIITSRAI